MKRFDELNRMEAQVQSEEKEQVQKKSRGFLVLLSVIILIGAVLIGVIIKIAFFLLIRNRKASLHRRQQKL